MDPVQVCIIELRSQMAAQVAVVVHVCQYAIYQPGPPAMLAPTHSHKWKNDNCVKPGAVHCKWLLDSTGFYKISKCVKKLP